MTYDPELNGVILTLKIEILKCQVLTQKSLEARPDNCRAFIKRVAKRLEDTRDAATLVTSVLPHPSLSKQLQQHCTILCNRSA